MVDRENLDFAMQLSAKRSNAQAYAQPKDTVKRSPSQRQTAINSSWKKDGFETVEKKWNGNNNRNNRNNRNEAHGFKKASIDNSSNNRKTVQDIYKQVHKFKNIDDFLSASGKMENGAFSPGSDTMNFLYYIIKDASNANVSNNDVLFQILKDIKGSVDLSAIFKSKTSTGFTWLDGLIFVQKLVSYERFTEVVRLASAISPCDVFGQNKNCETMYDALHKAKITSEDAKQRLRLVLNNIQDASIRVTVVAILNKFTNPSNDLFCDRIRYALTISPKSVIEALCTSLLTRDVKSATYDIDTVKLNQNGDVERRLLNTTTLYTDLLFNSLKKKNATEKSLINFFAEHPVSFDETEIKKMLVTEMRSQAFEEPKSNPEQNCEDEQKRQQECKRQQERKRQHIAIFVVIKAMCTADVVSVLNDIVNQREEYSSVSSEDDRMWLATFALANSAYSKNIKEWYDKINSRAIPQRQKVPLEIAFNRCRSNKQPDKCTIQEYLKKNSNSVTVDGIREIFPVIAQKEFFELTVAIFREIRQDNKDTFTEIFHQLSKGIDLGNIHQRLASEFSDDYVEWIDSPLQQAFINKLPELAEN